MIIYRQDTCICTGYETDEGEVDATNEGRGRQISTVEVEKR
jgi:hypothetical protein